MQIILGIVALAIIISVVLINRYFYTNMHYDEKLMKQTTEAGFVDKKVTLPDGSVINFGEGPNNGPALLLIHGQTVAWEDYVTVLPQLSKKFHVYAVDCYGHGQSSHNPSLYSLEATGKALKWFIDNEIGEPSYVSGHSSGGVLTAWLAANAPESVKGIVLEDPPLFEVTPEEMQEGKGSFAWKDTCTTIHNFLDQNKEKDYVAYYYEHSYGSSFYGGLKNKLAKSAQAYQTEHPGQPLKIFWIPYTWIRGMYYINNYDLNFSETFYNGSWMKGVDQEAMLRNIHVPTIYLKASTVYGKDGVLYAANTEADAKKVQSLIPGCERINVNSGHDIHYEHPDAFIFACEELLKNRIAHRVEKFSYISWHISIPLHLL